MVHFSFFFHASLAKDVIHPELFRNFSPPSGLPAAAVSAVVFIVKILTESRSQDPAFPQSPSCWTNFVTCVFYFLFYFCTVKLPHPNERRRNLRLALTAPRFVPAGLRSASSNTAVS
jgi:hypothetical protein